MIVSSGNANKSKTIPNGDDRTKKTFEQHREHERTEGHIERVTNTRVETRAGAPSTRAWHNFSLTPQ
jgi:hypothetical protein